MKTLNRCLLVVVLLLSGLSVHAAPRTFSFAFDGAFFANTAKAIGTITFEDTLLANTFDQNMQYTNYVYSTGGLELLALSLTVSGASEGNRTFDLADFHRVEWQTNGTLNLNAQLVGQPTVDDPWGTTDAGRGGDFNLFGSSASAPSGLYYFELASAGGESMRLTSMVPISAVPEPEYWAAFICGLGLLSVMARRRASMQQA